SGRTVINTARNARSTRTQPRNSTTHPAQTASEGIFPQRDRAGDALAENGIFLILQFLLRFLILHLVCIQPKTKRRSSQRGIPGGGLSGQSRNHVVDVAASLVVYGRGFRIVSARAVSELRQSLFLLLSLSGNVTNLRSQQLRRLC